RLPNCSSTAWRRRVRKRGKRDSNSQVPVAELNRSAPGGGQGVSGIIKTVLVERRHPGEPCHGGSGNEAADYATKKREPAAAGLPVALIRSTRPDVSLRGYGPYRPATADGSR